MLARTHEPDTMALPVDFIHQSFRYVLGRVSYAVSDWVDWCVAAWPTIPESERHIIQRELEHAFERDDDFRAKGAAYLPLGMDCDRSEWERVRALYQEQGPMTKPILCLDFDGVCHAYTSGWKGADVIPDPPVPGLFEFLLEASKHFAVHIFSSRSNQPGGIFAMQQWFGRYYDAWVYQGGEHDTDLLPSLLFPTEKPPAFLTIDDRAMTFTGTWPDAAALLAFKSWNRSGLDASHEVHQ